MQRLKKYQNHIKTLQVSYDQKEPPLKPSNLSNTSPSSPLLARSRIDDNDQGCFFFGTSLAWNFIPKKKLRHFHFCLTALVPERTYAASECVTVWTLKRAAAGWNGILAARPYGWENPPGYGDDIVGHARSKPGKRGNLRRFRQVTSRVVVSLRGSFSNANKLLVQLCELSNNLSIQLLQFLLQITWLYALRNKVSSQPDGRIVGRELWGFLRLVVMAEVPYYPRSMTMELRV